MKHATTRWSLLVATSTLAAGVGLLLPVEGAAQTTETVRLEGDRVAVYNLAGAMEIVRGDGPDVMVRVTRGGDEGDRLELAVDEIGGRTALRVLYPDDRIVYPEMWRGSRNTLRVHEDGTFGEGRGGERVEIRGGGRGIEAFADIRIELPRDRDLDVFVGAGEVRARDLEGDLRIDTGSGGVDVTGVRGSLFVDTGSGDVSVRDVEGEVEIDTGSGEVRADDLRGERIHIDTGSGEVEGSGFTARSLYVDTGSGSIELAAVSAPDAYLDTGSGSVDVEFLEDVEDLEVDTGSGSITLRFPPELGAEIEVETGSGGIEVDFPVELRTMRRNELEGSIGDGMGRIRIDTGSGSVRLIQTS